MADHLCEEPAPPARQQPPCDVGMPLGSGITSLPICLLPVTLRAPMLFIQAHRQDTCTCSTVSSGQVLAQLPALGATVQETLSAPVHSSLDLSEVATRAQQLRPLLIISWSLQLKTHLKPRLHWQEPCAGAHSSQLLQCSIATAAGALSDPHTRCLCWSSWQRNNRSWALNNNITE